ncbi:MmyB family transcriptional regulator [Streptomyces sp. NBC_01478]|uniref:MmyB family transcriptional regulator n=1 Tax=Streptomyces sp. NBC_01478 TaxID=2903882 RepID=UPI003FCCF4A6
MAKFRSSVRRYRHPRAGDIEVSFVRLAVQEGAWLSLICHFPEPGSESARRTRGLVTLPE